MSKKQVSEERIEFYEVEGKWAWARIHRDGGSAAAQGGFDRKTQAENAAKEHNPDLYAKPPDAKQIMGVSE